MRVIVKKNANFKNLLGKKFGKLTVISKDGKNKHGRTTWKCLCDCGKYKIITSSYLLNGDTISCGCYHSRRTHNMHDTKTYYVWRNHRNKKNGDFCEEWEKDFLNFYNDMGEKPKGKFLIRINKEEKFSKANCRWSAYFPKNNKFFIYKGEKLHSAVIAKKLGIRRELLLER